MKKIILGTLILFNIVNANAQVAVTATGGTASTSYSTLKAAFDAINAGTHTTIITIGISANTTEASSAVLNASGVGSASYASISIQPTGGAARTISGSIAGALISLNGADNVTIDGLNTGSNSLTIENSSTTTSASAIVLTGDATGNTITKTTVKGSTADNRVNAVITFSSGTNTNNTISYCNVGPFGSNKPWACIISGSAGTANNTNTVDHCNIYDFQGGTASGSLDRHSGVYLYNGSSTAWTITNNSFYQTGTISSAGGAVAIIYIMSGDGYTITGNYIGGSSANCGGTAMTYTGSIQYFYGIELGSNVGTTNTNTITGNYIQNIDWATSNSTNSSNSVSPRFSAILIRKGKFEISNNTIGKTTENGNITITHTGTAFSLFQFICGAYSPGGITVNNLNNNIISGISINATNFDAIGISIDAAVTPNYVSNINGNLIGSTTQANSISIALTTSSVTRSTFRALIVHNTPPLSGRLTVNGNTIQNISRGTGGTWTLSGIYNWADCDLTNNTISDISSTNTGIIYGIYLHNYYNPTSLTIVGNTIKNITSEASTLYGIYNLSKASIKQNFVSALTPTTTCTVYGIYTSNATDNGEIINNVVSLGYDKDGASLPNRGFNGIYVHNTGLANIYFNTVHIGGTGTSGTVPSYAFFKSSNSGTTVIKNNLFANLRLNSGGTGSHYAIIIAGVSTTTIDYNDYYAPNSGGILGSFATFNQTTLAAWKTATSQDANSLNVDPTFVSAGGAATSHYYPTTMQAGVTVSGITLDFNGETRNSTPMMGALETQCPTSITAATSTDITLTYTTAFAGSITSVTITTSAGAATFSGSNIASASTTSVRIPNLASPTSGISTIVSADYSDASSGIVTTDGTTTLTCGISMPLPITLLSFDAAKRQNDVYLTWETGSESNTDKFEIERSKDGLLFSNIGQVKAAGNSSTIKTYTFLDKNVGITFSDQKQYYRFKQIDFDGVYTFSPIRRIQFTQNLMGISVYPNPTNNTITIQASTYQEGSPYSITDHAGRQVLSGIIKNNKTAVDISYLTEGIYFVQVGELSNEIVKIVKY